MDDIIASAIEAYQTMSNATLAAIILAIAFVALAVFVIIGMR